MSAHDHLAAGLRRAGLPIGRHLRSGVAIHVDAQPVATAIEVVFGLTQFEGRAGQRLALVDWRRRQHESRVAAGVPGCATRGRLTAGKIEPEIGAGHSARPPVIDWNIPPCPLALGAEVHAQPLIAFDIGEITEDLDDLQITASIEAAIAVTPIAGLDPGLRSTKQDAVVCRIGTTRCLLPRHEIAQPEIVVGQRTGWCHRGP